MNAPLDIFTRLFGGGREGAWLIAGLGNPGAAYEPTRHNVGFRAVDRISRIAGIPVQKARFGALTGEGRFEGAKLVLIKPQTFMNKSGEAIRKAMDYYKTGHGRMIVIYDDVDVEQGAIRLRAFGGTGSHNGMRSIAEHIGDGAKFPRIRIGIGRQPNGMELSDYVLSRFKPDEEGRAEAAVAGAAEAALDVVRFGIERAMNAHNPKRRGKSE